MPYKTGDYPEGFDGEEISPLKELDPMKYKWEEDWVRPLLD